MNKKNILFLLFALVAMAGWAQEKGEVVWNEVVTGYSNISHVIRITKVTMNSDRTDLALHLTFPKGRQIGFPLGMVLKADGKEYAVTDATVIKLDELYTMPADTLDFVLTFAPLPTDTKAFDFVSPNGMQCSNIRSTHDQPDGIANTYWRNDATGDWQIGIAEKHVIYKNQIRDIAHQTEVKGTYSLTLDDGTVVKIGKMKKGRRAIAVGKEKPVACSLITGTTLPDYPKKDLRKGFVDNGYSLTDSATIVGWLKDMPQAAWQKGAEFDMQYDNIITNQEVNAYGKMDSLGRFSFKMPLMNSSEVFSDWGRTTLNTVLEPGKTYFFLCDFQTGQQLFMGDDVRVQNELLTHPHAWPVERISPEERGKITAMQFKARTDSIRSENMAELQERLQKHPNLSQRYIDYLTGYYLVGQGESMMQARYAMLDMQSHKILLPDEYMDYVNKEIWQKAPKPYTLYRDFTTVMKDYTDQVATKNNPFPSLQETMEVLDSVGWEHTLRDIYLAYNLYGSIDHSRTPLSEDALAYAEQQIQLPSALALVKAQNDKYIAIQQGDIMKLRKNLKSSDDIAGMSDGEKILRKLMEPYKGKFVLLDIWGTWCGPCKAALANSQEEYERLKDFDLVYLYLANQSEDAAWKNVIKEYNVTGDNVAHYNLPPEQQSAVENFLGVRAFPTYKLFDREGNLIDVEVDARDLEGLAHLLELLK
ncbi:MAG: TlpA family protein disulfide reductase [Bacteroidaceae bacterium]|nr:TlpA family protein disulfide reductase [Bacteroidaceae bacterium]